MNLPVKREISINQNCEVALYQRSSDNFFKLKKLTECYNLEDYWIRESDGFIDATKVLAKVPKRFSLLLQRQDFLSTLEQTSQELKLKLDYDILNDQSICYQERLYRLYSQLYDYQKIENYSIIWLHRKLAKNLNHNENLRHAIADWEQRTIPGSERECYITEISDGNSDDDRQNHQNQSPSLCLLRSVGCEITLYDAKDLLCLKVTNLQRSWSFLIDLETFRIYLDKRLLLTYGFNTEPKQPTLDRQILLSDEELRLAQTSKCTLDQLIPPDMLLEYEESSVGSSKGVETALMLYREGKCDVVELIPQHFAQNVHWMQLAVENIINSTLGETVREKLQHLGYTSPFLKSKVTLHETYTELKFGDVIVRQRNSDGFISANDFYRPFGKNLGDWLRYDSTFEFFKETAINEQLNFNLAYKTNSAKTRIAACFPDLIERRGGSPEAGGGTWVHPLISLKLAIDLSPAFAARAMKIIADYYASKSQFFVQSSLEPILLMSND